MLPIGTIPRTGVVPKWLANCLRVVPRLAPCAHSATSGVSLASLEPASKRAVGDSIFHFRTGRNNPMWRIRFHGEVCFLLVICCCVAASANDHKSVRPDAQGGGVRQEGVEGPRRSMGDRLEGKAARPRAEEADGENDHEHRCCDERKNAAAAEAFEEEADHEAREDRAEAAP